MLVVFRSGGEEVQGKTATYCRRKCAGRKIFCGLSSIGSDLNHLINLVAKTMACCAESVDPCLKDAWTKSPRIIT